MRKPRIALPVVVFHSPELCRVRLNNISIVLDTEDFLRAQEEQVTFLVVPLKNKRQPIDLVIRKKDGIKISLCNWLMKTNYKSYYLLKSQNDYRKKNVKWGHNKSAITPVYLNTYIKWIYNDFWFLTDLDKENDVKDWNVQRNSELAERNYYVSKVINVSPQKTIGVHRLMLPDITTHSSLYIDHINRVKQDNRLKNLRVVSPSENSMNKRGENLASKGVFYVKHAKKWRAQITYNKKRHSIGYFLTKEEAQIAYNKKALEISSCAFLPLHSK